MSVEPKRLAAVFFIPWRGEELDARDLLRRAGATDIVDREPSPENPGGLIPCLWAGLACLGHAETADGYSILTIRFWQSDFLALLNAPEQEQGPEDDAALPIAHAFRNACTALAPDVAFILAHLWQVDRNFIRARLPKVVARDAGALADEHFGLLFLSEEIARNWGTDPAREDRERLPIPRGLLVFAGRGASRWF